MRDSSVVKGRKSVTRGLNMLAAGGIVAILVVAATAVTMMGDKETQVSSLPITVTNS